MDIAGIEQFLAQGLNRMGLVLENRSEALARLSLYFQELKRWNRKVNLVGRSLDDQQLLENHFLDSLTLLELLQKESRVQETLIDVGTGAGFPGLVIKAACPELSVTLIEPRKNRFFFLKHVARIMNIKHVKILNVRLEEKHVIKELSGQEFSFITSRALTDMRQFIKLAAPYLALDGRIALMKGPGAAEELNDLAHNGGLEEFYVRETIKLHLPFSMKERWLVSLKRSSDI